MTVPQPPPGTQGWLGTTVGSPCGLTTALLEGDWNIQYVLWSTTRSVSPRWMLTAVSVSLTVTTEPVEPVVAVVAVWGAFVVTVWLGRVVTV